MKMKKVFVLWMMLHAVTLLYAQESAEIRNVSVKEFRQTMDALPDEVLIDLRTPEETGKGKIPGAVEIDFYGDNFRSALDGLDRNKPCLLYCAGGIRSGKAAALMQQLGFKKIYNLEDGYKGWVKEGMPVEESVIGNQ